VQSFAKYAQIKFRLQQDAEAQLDQATWNP